MRGMTNKLGIVSVKTKHITHTVQERERNKKGRYKFVTTNERPEKREKGPKMRSLGGIVVQVLDVI